MGAPACSRTRSASAQGSGFLASTRSSTTSSASPTSRTATRSRATISRAGWRRRSSFDDDGLELAIGCGRGDATAHRARDGARGDPRRGPRRRDAPSSLPRVHPTLDVVDAEPGVDETALVELEEPRAHRSAMGAFPPLLRRRQLRRPQRSRRRSTAERRRDRPLMGVGAGARPRTVGGWGWLATHVLQQQLVDAARGDRTGRSAPSIRR